MSTQDPKVFTVGHSKHPLDKFVALLQRHSVTAVADVRSLPQSRFNPQFNKGSLERSLRDVSIRYVFLGRELGARSNDPSCYEKGRVQYDRLARTDAFRDGIDRVLREANEHRICLMCAEKEPLECHRTLLVARALEAAGAKIAHIHADGRLEAHGDALERLLNLTGLPRDDLFRSREELLAKALTLQAKRVAFVDPKLAAEAREGAQ